MKRTRTGSLNIARDLVTQIGKNLLMGTRLVRNWRLKRPRTAAYHVNTDEFLQNYAFASLNLLLEYVGDLNGKSVCEIGPGDHLTSGMSILAAGASQYGGIDRFPGDYSGEASKHWYAEIARHWAQSYPNLPWPRWLNAADFPEGYPDRVEVIGQPLETAETTQKYDIVCSFQVAEHLSDIQAFADVHIRVLTDEGVGLHRVDFGPHDCWFQYRDPGTFLWFSDWLWKLTGSNRGVPNRKRHHEFMQAFDNADLAVEVLYTNDFDRSMMDLGRLNRKFREMPIESVLTGTAIYRLTQKS
ncbi:MAG: hypothetical protein KBD94_07600 [Pyrinomonadaceae bacterium]|nr:hypothetical protein [Pyrinomonadaceae bacterium]